MPFKLNSSHTDFTDAFQHLMHERSADSSQVEQTVKEIIAKVRSKGDAALLEYTQQFDRWQPTPSSLPPPAEEEGGGISVSAQEMAQAVSLCSPELMKSLKIAANRIRAYSQKQLPQDMFYTDEEGVELGWKWTAIDAVGLYVPGGKAAYPSSVLMNAIPALTAGVKRLAMVVPAMEGVLNPAILAAAHVAGISEIYKIGGAQAVAALAYGTETIAAVDKIVGPGNAYVAEAKRQVFGTVGIDMIAGPSEIVVVADRNNNPEWIAADLLSQAEHDEAAQAILITTDEAFATAVEKAVQALLQTLPRRAIAGASWQAHGCIIIVKNWPEATSIINQLAPEHVELAMDDAAVFAQSIRHAGAIFLGRYTPEAIGDYIAGPSHVLPTSRTARFASGLSVLDFVKRTSLIGCSEQASKALGMYGQVLAETEGLAAHRLSMSLRDNS